MSVGSIIAVFRRNIRNMCWIECKPKPKGSPTPKTSPFKLKHQFAIEVPKRDPKAPIEAPRPAPKPPDESSYKWEKIPPPPKKEEDARVPWATGSKGSSSFALRIQGK